MRTVVKKLIQLMVVLFFVTFFSFSLLKLIPGDPVSTLKPFATPEQAAGIRAELGLDKPFFSQYYSGVKAKLLPTQQYVPFGENVGEHFKHMVLPAVSLAVGQVAIYMRLLRSDMIQTLQEDFITMAKAKGLTNRRILLRHALRPSSFSLLTVAALNVGALIGGAVVIEQVFQLPGLGLKLVQAIATRQYVALQAYVAIIAVAYVAFNALVDILYVVLDPRIRHA